jgi:hypothetical protein
MALFLTSPREPASPAPAFSTCADLAVLTGRRLPHPGTVVPPGTRKE